MDQAGARLLAGRETVVGARADPPSKRSRLRLAELLAAPTRLFGGGRGRGCRGARSRAKQPALFTADEFDRRLHLREDLLPAPIRRIVKPEHGGGENGAVDSDAARGHTPQI